jgi:hypothetical protein
MPFAKLALKPGVDTQRSPTLNEAGISDSQLIRFPFGLPEKQGGWQSFPNLPLLIGICRGLFGWADLKGTPYLAVGTEQRLEVMNGGALADITPLRAVTNPAVSFSTTAGSASVLIHDPGHGAVAGDWINLLTYVSVGGLLLQGYYQIASVLDGSSYVVQAAKPATSTVTNGGAVAVATTTSGSATVTLTLANHGLLATQFIVIAVPTTVGGVTIAGSYNVASVPDANTFTIIAGTSATSSATGGVNGGNARINYLIPSGLAVPTYTTGWGIGDFGMGDWGAGSSGSELIHARQWSLFNFGQDLIASPSYGMIYYWQPPTIQPAVVVDPSAPLQNIVVFGMGQVQIIISAGAEALGILYPTLVRWCDSGDFTDWVASATNQAGSYQIPTGSTAVSGLAIGLGALIWTDVDLWSMSYIGTPFIFSFNRVGISCEPMSMKAVAVCPGNLVVWPGPRGFFRFDGGTVSPLACTVWDVFFTLLDSRQRELVFSALNAMFNEVSWYYLRTDGQIGYVRWNFANNLWDLGVLDRTAWTELSPVGNPIGASTAGILYEHEIGANADASPLSWSFTTGYFDLQAGEDFAFVDFFIPDFVGSYAAIEMTIFATDAPNLRARTYGPFTIQPGTEYINVRVRGRQLALKFSGNDLNSQVRLGGVRYRFATAGRRG